MIHSFNFCTSGTYLFYLRFQKVFVLVIFVIFTLTILCCCSFKDVVSHCESLWVNQHSSRESEPKRDLLQGMGLCDDVGWLSKPEIHKTESQEGHWNSQAQEELHLLGTSYIRPLPGEDTGVVDHVSLWPAYFIYFQLLSEASDPSGLWYYC